MGAVKRVMITGASGFIGRAAVAQALAEGLEVVAIVRSSVPQSWRNIPRLTVYRLDLTSSGATDTLAEMMEVDAVVHAAAHLGSDTALQERDTLVPTETLLHAMLIAGVKHLVLISSLGVYDTARLWPYGTVTEATPLEAVESARDGYVKGKLMQEALCQRAADRRGLSLAILRPGAVYGPGRSWNAHIGVALGPLLFRVGFGGELPLCHVTTCARAIVAAARSEAEGAINVLDDDRPTRGRFLRRHRRSGWPRLSVPVPWWLFLLAGTALSVLPGRRPGLLRPAVLKARMMPLRYSSDLMHEVLNVPDSPAFEVLMDDALAGEPQ